MRKFLYLMMAVLVLGLAPSCGGGGETQESSEDMQEQLQDEMIQEESGDFPEEEHSFYLPSALQIGTIFKRSGLGYVDGITASPENASKFVSKNSQLLNFGVYSADMAYSILNDQSQNSLALLKAVKDLSENIGFGSIFNKDGLAERFEANIGNQDSILNLLVEIQENTDVFISENDMRAQTYVIFAGAWIEGMYLGVKAFNRENKGAVSKRLIEQMNILNNLLGALEGSKRNLEDIDDVVNGLNGIKTYYEEMDIRDADGRINFSELELSDEDMDAIAEKILTLRSTITEA